MKILFVTDLHYLPQGNGGCQSLIHELALALIERGHQPSVLTTLDYRGYVGLRTRFLMKVLRQETVRDRMHGYSVYRRWTMSDLRQPIAAIAPDVAVALPKDIYGIARELAALSVPTVAYFQDVFFRQLSGDPGTLKHVRFAANSRFTARRCEETYGLQPVVIPPLIRAGRYLAARNPRYVTMINPHPQKGGNLVLDIASRLPEIPFCLVESWELEGTHRENLHARLRTLPNVKLKPRTDDMKSIYSGAKILLAPSLCEEAWGRVASEAHINGIPVVASNRGGLPEAVGPGGAILDPEAPIDLWVGEIRRLWTDADYYREKSQAALAHAGRPELDSANQIDALLALLREAAPLRPLAA
ncbi:MAG TPA: glycosyltransferase [Rhizomicrobium sp.]|jgi:glycosyltransferase involved in cell wall biosynthesis|nr:glycosyltransferase [Rhizomicrobium sp.]